MNLNESSALSAAASMLDQAARRAAASLSEMVNLPVSVKLTRAELLDQREAGSHLLDPGDGWGKGVHIHFDGEISGEAMLLLPKNHDDNLINAILTQVPELRETPDPSETVLIEIGNVLLNASVGTLANHTGKHIQYQPPSMISDPQLTEMIRTNTEKTARLVRILSTLSVGELQVNPYLVIFFYLAA